MATTKTTKAGLAASAQQLIAGTTKHLAATTNVVVQGQSLSVAQVVERLQTLVSLRNDVDTAKAQTKAKLAAEAANMPSLRAFYAAYVTYVKATFAGVPDTLADFGLHPKTRAPLTVEAKAAAAAKRKATRAARHTMGSQQKKSVKGAVVGAAVTPVAAAQPAAATPPAANAPTAPAASAGATANAPTRAT